MSAFAEGTIGRGKSPDILFMFRLFCSFDVPIRQKIRCFNGPSITAPPIFSPRKSLKKGQFLLHGKNGIEVWSYGHDNRRELGGSD